MHFDKLQRGEIIACVGGFLLAVAVFLPWYSTDSGNPNSRINGRTCDFSAWDAHTVSRFLFLLGAAAPFILAWIVVREHQLSWPRGEMTAVLAMVGLVLVLYVGVIARPGQPAGAVSLGAGWYLAALGCILECAGGAVRAGSTERPRKPPGVL